MGSQELNQVIRQEAGPGPPQCKSVCPIPVELGREVELVPIWGLERGRGTV